MEVSCPEKNTPAGRRKAIEKLRQGFEHAKQLQILINKSSSGDNETSMDYSSSGDLLEMVSNSFSYAISFFNNVDQFGEANQSPASMPVRNSDFSERSSKSTTKVKGRRGCYKRRKTEETWSTERVNWEDGHAWRKYGQKVIHNHKYPRNYYRCTHKSNGCPATKQVQQIKDDPPIHRTTYHGNHTCQDLLNPSQTIFEDESALEDYSSVLVSFDNSHLTIKQEDDNKVNPFFSSSLLSIKQEHNVDYHSHEVPHINQSSSSDDYLFSPDELTAFGSSLSYDHVDVISCTASTHHHNFDMRSIDHFEDDVLKQYGF